MDGPATSLNILIVEDSADDAELLLLELRRHGMQVRSKRVDTAETMREALAAEPFDLVLCDHTMPRFDSQQALEIVRQAAPDIPFIIVSGTLGEEYAVAAMRSGCHDYIMKDNLKRLAPAIERELREAEVRKARSRAEKELRQTTTVLDNILASASEFAIVAIDRDRKVLHCNPAAERLLGVDARQAVGADAESAGIFRTVTSESPQEVLDVVDEAGKWVCERQIADKGGPRYLRSVIMPMRDEGGKGIGYVLFTGDATAQKEAERQQRQLETELLHSQKLESLGVMAGGIAHDFNNLLAIIRGNLECLASSLKGDPADRAAIDNIQTAIGHAVALTRGLQTFSRPQQREIRVVDVNVVIQEAYDLMRRVLPKAVRFQCLPDAKPCPVAADSAQLQQVLINLCMNARDAMPNGGCLTMATARLTDEQLPPATREKITAKRFVRIRVTDTGCGMDLPIIERIFDPFFTTKAKNLGTGLGLAMVYRIVQAHHGSIEVASTPGQGSQFDVYLPLHEQALVEPAASKPGAAPGSSCVLVVDNQEMVAGLLQTLLEQRGCSAVVCQTGREALRLVSEGRNLPVLVIVSQNLGDMTGTQCLEAILGPRPNLKGLLIGEKAPLPAGLQDRVRVIPQPCAAGVIVERVVDMLNAASPARNA